MSTKYQYGIFNWNLTRNGRLHLFTRAGEPWSKDRLKPLKDMPGHVADTDISMIRLRHDRYSSRGSGFHKKALAALRELNINTLRDLVGARQVKAVVDAGQGEHCGQYATILRDTLASLYEFCPAVVDIDYVPPVVIPINISTLVLNGMPEELDWSEFDTETRNGIREILRHYLTENAEDLIRKALIGVRQAKVEALRAELASVERQLENLTS